MAYANNERQVAMIAYDRHIALEKKIDSLGFEYEEFFATDDKIVYILYGVDEEKIAEFDTLEEMADFLGV